MARASALIPLITRRERLLRTLSTMFTCPLFKLFILSLAWLP